MSLALAFGLATIGLALVILIHPQFLSLEFVLTWHGDNEYFVGKMGQAEKRLSTGYQHG
jgi:hypothetical protein